MRVLMLGAGAIGGHYGERLIEAGHEVSFLVGAPRAARLAAGGLRVHGGEREFAASVDAISVVPAVVRYDLVVLSCKAWDLDSTLAAIAPAVGATTRVLPLLNGLRHLDALDAAFGAARVLGGLCQVSATLEDDGAIRRFGRLDRLTFGSRERRRWYGRRSRPAGVVESDDILAAMWDKFSSVAIGCADPAARVRGAARRALITRPSRRASTRRRSA